MTKKLRMEIITIKPAHEDQRGYITNIVEDGHVPQELKKRITHMAVYTSKKDTRRGDHYHPKQIQAVYLISGKYESLTKDLDDPNSKIERHIIEPGQLVICWPNVAHAQVFLEDSVLLNLTDGERESEKFEEHTIKYQVE